MEACARLRVQGKTWEEIADELPRASETMRAWPYKRADEWGRALVTAIDETLPTYENEALLVCRQHLRQGADPAPSERQLAQVAARDLLRHVRELRGRRMKFEVSGPDGAPLLSTTDLIARFRNGAAKPTEDSPAEDDPEDGS